MIEHGRTVIVDKLATLELERSEPLIYDRPIGIRLLYHDPRSGAEHYLVRYPAGLKALPHRHTAAQTVVVLEGQFEVNGKTLGPGAYCHFPGGEAAHHAPGGSDPCLFVTIFDGPFDVHPLARAPRRREPPPRGGRWP